MNFTSQICTSKEQSERLLADALYMMILRLKEEGVI